MGKKSGRKWQATHRRVRNFARARGLPQCMPWEYYAPYLEQYAGIEAPPGIINSSPRQRCKRAIDVIDGKGDKLPSRGRSPRPPKKRADEIKAFYQSYEWRRVRYEILQHYGRRCMCCGATGDQGVYIHVDHIKPLRFNWEFRLDKQNLQVLCEVCNHGKGNWDETDWRPKKSKLKEPKHQAMMVFLINYPDLAVEFFTEIEGWPINDGVLKRLRRAILDIAVDHAPIEREKLICLLEYQGFAAVLKGLFNGCTYELFHCAQPGYSYSMVREHWLELMSDEKLTGASHH